MPPPRNLNQKDVAEKKLRRHYKSISISLQSGGKMRLGSRIHQRMSRVRKEGKRVRKDVDGVQSGVEKEDCTQIFVFKSLYFV